MMETETPNHNNGSTPRIKENGFLLRPVSVEEAGEGLPYAPENWPNPGDNWTWRVGKRIAITGHYLDRYIYLPERLCQLESSTRKKYGFASKLSVEKYLRSAFPGADIEAFFSSFSWKIPAKKSSSSTNGILNRRILFPLPSEERRNQLAVSDFQSDTVTCKARNSQCSSLSSEATNPSLLPVMPCDICCSEPQFCRDCCCILCSKTIDLTHGGYNHIKCDAMVDGYICGHLAHIECSLRSYMAGTVGGSIGLDAEYYCRRCDARTNLVSHIRRLLKTCESIDSREEVEKILGIGVCVLRGSSKTSAKELLSCIEVAIDKLKSGVSLGDIWKGVDNILAICTGVSDNETPNTVTRTCDMSIPFDHRTESLRLDEEVNHVLEELRKSQDYEYKLAVERLRAQKSYIDTLYQQLDRERTELARRTPSTDPDTLLDDVLSRVEQIKTQVMKLREIEKVANGFGKTSKVTLKEAFGLEVVD